MVVSVRIPGSDFAVSAEVFAETGDSESGNFALSTSFLKPPKRSEGGSEGRNNEL
jgi:hypothetical protein